MGAGKKQEKSYKARAKRAEKRHKHNKSKEAAMKKAFEKNEKKIAMCGHKFDVKGHKANHYKGRCRAFKRFCDLYKKFGLHDEAEEECKKAAKAHAKMVRHHKIAAKKAKKTHHRHYRLHHH